jgi:hypothetical protein
MIRLAIAVLALLLGALAPPPSTAQSPLGFDRGPSRGVAASRGKLLVVELGDPNASGIARPASLVLLRELRAAFGEHREASIVYVPAAAGSPLAERLARDGHRAALALAGEQQARMVLWGALAPSGNDAVVSLALTLLAPSDDQDLVLQLVSRRIAVADVASEFAWTRINLPPQLLTRAQLFQRLLVVGTSGAQLRAEPEASGAPLRMARPAETLLLRDARNDWFEIADGNRRVHLDARPRAGAAADLRILPRRGYIAAAGQLLGEPRARSRVIARLAADRTVSIIAYRREEEGKEWLQVESGGRRGWLPEGDVLGIEEFAGTTLAAAQLRFAIGDLSRAAQLALSFVEQGRGGRDNVSAAAALQLAAIARLRQPVFEAASADAGLALLDRAIDQTPLDPAAYALRAVARLGVRAPGHARRAVEDLDAALGIDPTYARARALVAAVHRHAVSAGGLGAELGFGDPAARRLLDGLIARLAPRAESEDEPRRLIEDIQQIFDPPR